MTPITQCDILYSQKARGVRDLALKGPQALTAIARDTYILHEEDIDAFAKQAPLSSPWFARPCPSKPRHGFVDSRVVKSGKEILPIVEEIKATGEPVEIMMCPFIDKAEWNAIVTPETITVGSGNDGATSGKSLSFRTVYPIKFLTGSAKLESGHPYIEVVEGPGYGRQLVQLREGPEPPKTPDYIPQKTTVKRVIVAEEQDLLEWEALIKAAAPGTVVYLNGKGWTSHYAVHANCMKFPVISSHLPKVGEVLVQTDTYEPTEQDLQRMAKYLAHVLSLPTISSKNQIKECFAIFHHFGLWNTWTEAECKMAAWSVGIFPRITFALGAGEMRHWSSHTAGSSIPARWGWVKGHGREGVYDIADSVSMPGVAALMPWMVKDFRDSIKWPGGYGGMKWSVGAEHALHVMQSACHFCVEPSKEQWDLVVSHMNKMAFAVHNGGRYHNKVIDEGTMDGISKVPGRYMLDFAYKLLYQTYPSMEDVNPAKVGSALLGNFPVVPVSAAKAQKTKQAETPTIEVAEDQEYHQSYEEKLASQLKKQQEVQAWKMVPPVSKALHEWEFKDPQVKTLGGKNPNAIYVHTKLGNNYVMVPGMYPKDYGVGFSLSLVGDAMYYFKQAVKKAKKQNSHAGTSTEYWVLQSLKFLPPKVEKDNFGGVQFYGTNQHEAEFVIDTPDATYTFTGSLIG